MRLTWQNLTQYGDEAIRGLWRHGRAWLRRDRETPSRYDGLLASLEWNIGDWPWEGSLWLRVDEDDADATLSFGVPGVHLYLTVPVPEAVIARLPFRHRRSEYTGGHRAIGIQLDASLTFRWSFWEDQHEGRAADPAWMRGSIDLMTLLFGRSRMEVEDLESQRVEIGMPEGVYTGTATARRHVWRRSRVPWPTEDVMRVHVVLDKPIPIPGKGETDYDQDDDGIYEGTYTAASIEEGVAQLAASVLRDRLRRAGSFCMQTEH